MLSIFTPEDIEDLKHNPSDNTKLRVVEKLARTFDLQELTNEEKLIATQILRLLAADISARIRIAVSEKFSQNNNVPYDVVLKLADDIEDFVAIPMLQFSNLLQDEDLTRIIANRQPVRQGAIARRDKMSDAVKVELITKGEPYAVEALIENDNTHMDKDQVDAIIMKFSENERVLNQLISNKRVSLEQAHEMIAKVSEELRKVIILKYDIPASTVSNLVFSSREWLILSMIRAHADKSKKTLPLKQIIEKLHGEGELTFTIIVKSLSMGDLDFVTAAFAKLSDLPVENVQKLIEVGGDQVIDGLFRKAHLPPGMSKPVAKLLDVVKEERRNDIKDIEVFERRVMDRIARLADERAVDHIGHLVTILAHNPKF